MPYSDPSTQMLWLISRFMKRFFQIAFGQFWWPCVTFGLSFPFLADKVSHSGVWPRKWLCGKITIYQHFVLKYSEQLLWHQQQCHIQSHLHHLSTLFWYSVFFISSIFIQYITYDPSDKKNLPFMHYIIFMCLFIVVQV